MADEIAILNSLKVSIPRITQVLKLAPHGIIES